MTAAASSIVAPADPDYANDLGEHGYASDFAAYCDGQLDSADDSDHARGLNAVSNPDRNLNRDRDPDHGSGRDPDQYLDQYPDQYPDHDPDRPRGRPSVLDSGAVAAADLVRSADALGRQAGPSLPVLAPLDAVLPEGLRRGSTVSVTNSVSLLLALLGGPSAAGAWCATVGLPAISAEAAAEYGIDLARLAIVATPGAGWLTAVGALLDAVDVVVVRPPVQVSDGDLRRLAARARGRDAVLMPYLGGRPRWPRADLELAAHTERWTGLGVGHGRLHARQVTVAATGRGRASRPRSVACWLPAIGGGIAPITRTAVARSVPELQPELPELQMPELRAG